MIAKYYEAKFNDGVKHHKVTLLGFTPEEAIEKLSDEYIGDKDIILDVNLTIPRDDHIIMQVGNFKVKYTAPVKGSSRIFDNLAQKRQGSQDAPHLDRDFITQSSGRI